MYLKLVKGSLAMLGLSKSTVSSVSLDPGLKQTIFYIVNSGLRNPCCVLPEAVLRIQILWIRKILASWIRIQGAIYQQKLQKNYAHTKSEVLKKKRDYKYFLISEWHIKF